MPGRIQLERSNKPKILLRWLDCPTTLTKLTDRRQTPVLDHTSSDVRNILSIRDRSVTSVLDKR